MTKERDPTKEPEFQRVVQTLLRTPHKPHKPLGKHKRAIKKASRATKR
jgi:hypothetical protein